MNGDRIFLDECLTLISQRL